MPLGASMKNSGRVKAVKKFQTVDGALYDTLEAATQAQRENDVTYVMDSVLRPACYKESDGFKLALGDYIQLFARHYDHIVAAVQKKREEVEEEADAKEEQTFSI